MSDIEQLPTGSTAPAEYGNGKIEQATRQYIDEIAQKYGIFREALAVFRNGSATMEWRRRVLLRAIDETWVRAVEDSLPALDAIVRNPSRFIVESEEVLPIELSRNITSRSLRHLSQHTDYISRVEGDEVTPSKILNVFKEETVLTYENKFVNTLLARLYSFVSRRYDQAKKSPEDTKTTALTYDQSFEHGDIKGKISFSIEVEEAPAEGDVLKNYTYTTDLWRRVEKLESTCRGYMSSVFVRELDKNFIRPPVIRTNAILKNKDLRRCLALWEFIESYENIGYSMLVEESLETIDPEYVRDLYSSMAVQYLLFRRHAEGEEETLATAETEAPLAPKISEDLQELNSAEFDAHYGVDIPQPSTLKELTPTDMDILEAIEVALDAAEQLRRAEPETMPESDFFTAKLRRSFLSRYIQADEETQDFYGEVKNELLAYKRVKSRISWAHEAFNRGRSKLARLVFRGKTLVLFLALDPDAYDKAKYHHTDFSDKAKYAELPFALKLRSKRAVKYAKELIAALMQANGLPRAEIPEVVDHALPRESTVDLIGRGLIKVVALLDADEMETLAAEHDTLHPKPKALLVTALGDGDGDSDTVTDAWGRTYTLRYRKSFTAKLIQSDTETQDFYTALKNELLSYKKVKSRISWHCDTFNKGRDKLAKIAIRGKTLVLYLALDPAEFPESKYHHTDSSDTSRYAEVPFTLRVRSDRAVKYAKELIAALMERHGTPQGELPTEDYHLPFEPNSALLARELIKIEGEAPADLPSEAVAEIPAVEIVQTPTETIDETSAVETPDAPAQDTAEMLAQDTAEMPAEVAAVPAEEMVKAPREEEQLAPAPRKKSWLTRLLARLRRKKTR